MKNIISTLLFFHCILSFAQSFDGHKGIYDSRTNTFLICVPKNYQNNNLPANVFTTFLPIVKLEGNFGYEYNSGVVSIYMPNEEDKESMTANIKWRGGSTNAFDKHKRNYKIKFDYNQQFFGLRKDNNWILDAGQADLFRVRNRIATDIWNDMAHKPYYSNEEPEALSGVRGHMVELFLNDEYRGIYCLTENMDRKELKVKKIDNSTGIIRGCVWKGKSYNGTLMYDSPSNYDTKSDIWLGFEIKYPDLSDKEETEWYTLWNAINFVAYSSNEEFKEHIAEYFDIPVLIDYFIFMDVLNVSDNDGKNLYWAVYDKTKNKKLTLAVWDLDASVGQKWLEKFVPGSSDAKYEKSASMNIYKRLIELNVDNFNNKVLERYKELRNSIFTIDGLTQRYIYYYNDMKLSGAAQREQNLWSGDTDIDGEILDFDKELLYIQSWIKNHIEYLDNHQYNSTGITNIIRDNNKNNNIYNINGQLVKTNIQKRIIIKEGRKYLVR